MAGYLITALLLQQRNIRNAQEQFAQFLQHGQTVETQFFVINHDHHFIEESINRLTQLCQFDQRILVTTFRKVRLQLVT